MRAQRREISSSQPMTVRCRGGGRTIGPSSSGADGWLGGMVDVVAVAMLFVLSSREFYEKREKGDR